MISHSELHLLMLKAMVDQDAFVDFRMKLFESLAQDKTHAGKGRLLRSISAGEEYLGEPCYISISERLKIGACLEVVKTMEICDPLIVEKSYLLLEDLISYFKLQGLEEVCRYFDENPILFQKYQQE